MKCAVQLVFSENDQTKINRLRNALAEKGVHDEAVPINHISIADIEIDERQLDSVAEVLDKFAKTHGKIKLILGVMGTFMTSENVLFLAPTMTDELIQLNDDMISDLKEIGVESGKYYIKNNPFHSLNVI